MSLISVELLCELMKLNKSVIGKEIIHPSRLALKLEEIAAIAWEEAKELGCTTLEEAEDLQPSLQIQP
ncbi:MAG: hypothetical protein WBF90_19415 [Rivularia sp. (in: cyanobacteria)]